MSRHQRNEELSSFAIDDVARDWARGLEDRERIRSGVALPVARKAVARRIGVPTGTLETLRSGRRKSLTVWLFHRLKSAIINEMQQEIARCTHELEIARQVGCDPRSGQMEALARAVDEAQKMMAGGQ